MIKSILYREIWYIDYIKKKKNETINLRYFEKKNETVNLRRRA